jgi:hypothetical protein
MSYVFIQLTQGRYAKIDAEDEDKVSRTSWHTKHYSNGYYAYSTINGKSVQLAHLILNIYPKRNNKFVIDHINRDPLDNRKENLRIISYSQNTINSGWVNNRSGIIGVSHNKKKYCYAAFWNENKKTNRFNS